MAGLTPAIAAQTPLVNGQPIKSAEVNAFVTAIVNGYNNADCPNPSGVDIYQETLNTFPTIAFANAALDNPIFSMLDDYCVNCMPPLEWVAADSFNIQEGTWIVTDNGAGTKRLRMLSADLNVEMIAANIDTGLAPVASTLYYVYGIADATGTSFTCKMTANDPTAAPPAGVTHYRLLGTVYYDAASEIKQNSVVTLDKKFQDYELLKLPINTGSYPSLLWQSNSEVRVPANTFLNIMGLKKFIAANLDIDLSDSADRDTGVSESVSTLYDVYAVATTDSPFFTGLYTLNGVLPTSAAYYLKLGTAYNDASGNISNVLTNDGHDQYIKSSYYQNMRIETGSGTIALGATDSGAIALKQTMANVTDLVHAKMTPTDGAAGAGPTEYFIWPVNTTSTITWYSNKAVVADLPFTFECHIKG